MNVLIFSILVSNVKQLFSSAIQYMPDSNSKAGFVWTLKYWNVYGVGKHRRPTCQDSPGIYWRWSRLRMPSLFIAAACEACRITHLDDWVCPKPWYTPRWIKLAISCETWWQSVGMRYGIGVTPCSNTHDTKAQISHKISDYLHVYSILLYFGWLSYLI